VTVARAHVETVVIDGEEHAVKLGVFPALPGSIFPERADRVPAGFWQRTGRQLLPASR
jgi:hypothetical protein